jgi:predicted dehydrogenase
MSDSPLSRRSFVKAAAMAAAPAAIPALGQSKIAVGVIGTGGRGNYLLQRLHAGDAARTEVTALCDTYSGNLNRVKDSVATLWGRTPKTYVDYKELLADPNVQLVIIATPEHLHYEMTMAAVKAGKHIYIEKPLAQTIEQGEEIVQAVKTSGKKVQVGTQNRSNSLYGMARQMISQGMIGEVHYVRAFWYRNALANGAPAWRYTIPEEANEQNTDWKRFLGSAPSRPFNKPRYFQWRLYWDYSGGISTDLLVHQTDITNFVLGKDVPLTCMASGGIYRWTDPDDDRDVPDTLSALYEYDGRFHLNYSCYFGNEFFGYGEQFLGNEGTIQVLNRQILKYNPETPRPNSPPWLKTRKELSIELPGNDNLAVEAHLRNLLDAIEKNVPLVAPVEVGQEAAIGGHMATLSYRNKKMVRWDNKARKYSFV